MGSWLVSQFLLLLSATPGSPHMLMSPKHCCLESLKSCPDFPVNPYRWKPTRLPSLGFSSKSTGVGGAIFQRVKRVKVTRARGPLATHGLQPTSFVSRRGIFLSGGELGAGLPSLRRHRQITERYSNGS